MGHSSSITSSFFAGVHIGIAQKNAQNNNPPVTNATIATPF
jgi:hypothetical protein